MCTIAGIGKWLTKNKEPGMSINRNILMVTGPDLPELSFILLTPHFELIDLNEHIKEAIEEKRYQSLSVKRSTHPQFRDIKEWIPEKILPVYRFMMPVILDQTEEPTASMVSVDNLSQSWAGIGKIAAVTSAVHHRDRSSYLLQGMIMSQILNLKLDEAIEKIKEFNKQYNITGFNMILADEDQSVVVDYLYNKLVISQIKDFAVRTNFSPRVGYWDIGWDPEKDHSKDVKITRAISRYLRAYSLFSNLKKPSFESIQHIMSDHMYYPGISRRVGEVYNQIMSGNIDEILKNIRKVEEGEGYNTMCTHPSKTRDGFSDLRTTYNFVSNIKTREARIIFGNPCENTLSVKVTV